MVRSANGNAGDSIVIKHAEVLDKEGNFYTENLRAAKATATYILKGGGEEIFEPHFTFFGFRYIKIENCVRPPGLEHGTLEVYQFNCLSARLDSNQGPQRYKLCALPTELQADKQLN